MPMPADTALQSLWRVYTLIDRSPIPVILDDMTSEQLANLPPNVGGAIIQMALAELHLWQELLEAIRKHTCECPASLREAEQHSVGCPLYATEGRPE